MLEGLWKIRESKGLAKCQGFLVGENYHGGTKSDCILTDTNRQLGENVIVYWNVINIAKCH